METVIKISCQDEKGLVHKITGILYEKLLNVTRTNEFVDEAFNQFFMRISYVGDCDVQLLKKELFAILPKAARVDIIPPSLKEVVLLVTKEHHCLGDLLIRSQFQDLPFKISAVIGNHAVLQGLCEQFNMPFHLISADGLSREDHEKLVEAQIDAYNPDYIVLAKYMRILSPDFSAKYLGRMINIHHSFLPAFVGAKPYQQAFDRGVKIIGATAHFVTDDLDEGPIICQDIVAVNHSFSAKEMAKAGKDVEKIVLANALKMVFEDRVFMHRNKTIIFD
ncbi:formyltetrahydrofolate deformylase [Aquirufa sp.]|jgi:formyltetrahydrofolate deformylase|uniref:formyltetrahydrofolate deformylase n=1 Tax=Aquirufa sp. TaxID=2676249 RepID=UPI0037C0B8B4